MGKPKYNVGSNASISPPVQAQSAGDQNTSPCCGNPSCECTKPGRLPSRHCCGISAPFGGPVVPLVYTSSAGSMARVETAVNRAEAVFSSDSQSLVQDSRAPATPIT